MIVACRALRVHIALSTKGESIGRQLDVYARRDPQLVPYLLRQVDTEFQRGCYKIKYIFWVGIFVAVLLYDIRVESELSYFLMPYFAKLGQYRDQEVRDYEQRQWHAKHLLELLERLRDDPGAMNVVRQEIHEKIKKFGIDHQRVQGGR